MPLFLRFCAHHLLVLVTLCSMTGAAAASWLGQMIPEPAAMLYALPLLLLLAVGACALPSRARPLTALPLFFVIGLLHTQAALQPPKDPSHIYRHIDQKTAATVVGTIRTMPEYNGETTRCILDCESLLKADPKAPAVFQPIRGRLLLTIQDQPPPDLHAGTRIMALASIDRLHRYQTPGAFHFPLQMATQKIHCSAWVEAADAIEPVYSQTNPGTVISTFQQFRFFPEQLRQQMAVFLENALPLENAGLYQALLIGSLVNIPLETLEAFKASGCFHILAISGLHFSLLGLFALTVLLFTLKRSQWLLLHTHVPSLALLLTAPILFLYAFVAGMNLPALRALITALLVLTAVLLRRQRSLLPLIAAAALLILACNPLALFTASFQLSFAAVLAINLIYPRLPVFSLPDDTRRPWLKFLGRGWRIGQSMFFVSLAATAGTLPVLLFHFNRISLPGPVMNLLVEPLLCLWALPWGLAAFILLWPAPQLAAACLHCGEWGLEAALWLIKTINHLPHLSLWTITPAPLEIGLYYALLWLIIQRPAIPYRTLFAVLLFPILIGSFTFSLWNPWPENKLTVHYLDVGQGTSTLLQLPLGKSILIDGGGYQSDRFDSGQDLIAPFLWHRRLWRLDTVIITHPHGDHYNGLPFLLERFRPKRLVINGDDGDESAYQRLLAQARQLAIPLSSIRTGATLYQKNQVRLQCLGMPGLPDLPRWSTNDRSLVLALRNGDHRFLFPADIGFPSEQVLLRSGADLRATVLLAPHHGSRSSASDTFIKAVAPKLIIASAGRNRQGVLPAPEHLQTWKEQKILTLITAQAGTVTLKSDGKCLQARTFTGDEFFLNGETEQFQEEKCGLKGEMNRGMFSH